jgi:hypothetical protein
VLQKSGTVMLRTMLAKPSQVSDKLCTVAEKEIDYQLVSTCGNASAAPTLASATEIQNNGP